MKILVFVKQVPDTTDVKLDPKTGNLNREGVESIMNPLDANAVEAALQLKEKYGATVVAVSMGVSLLLASIPLFAQLAEGTRIILITVGISAGAALLFPVKEEKEASHGA